MPKIQQNTTNPSLNLIPEQPLYFGVALACKVGLKEAIFLQKLYYWMRTGQGYTKDNKRWIYNPREEWVKQLPCFTERTFDRIISALKKDGCIEVIKGGYGKPNSYTITGYYVLNPLSPEICENQEQYYNEEIEKNYHIEIEEFFTDDSMILGGGKPHTVYPSLISKLGLVEAIILTQLHYWTWGKEPKNDGLRWIRTTLDNLEKMFPYLSRSSIRRALDKLHGLGIIQKSTRHNKKPKIDRTISYAIDSLSFKSFLEKSTKPDVQNGELDMLKMASQISPNCTNQLCQNEQMSISINNTEKSTDIDKHITEIFYSKNIQLGEPNNKESKEGVKKELETEKATVQSGEVEEAMSVWYGLHSLPVLEGARSIFEAMQTRIKVNQLPYSLAEIVEFSIGHIEEISNLILDFSYIEIDNPADYYKHLDFLVAYYEENQAGEKQDKLSTSSGITEEEFLKASKTPPPDLQPPVHSSAHTP